MQLRDVAFPVRLLLSGFSRRGYPSPSIIVGFFLFSLFQTGLVIAGSYLDGTFHLEHGGKGFLEHYGVWAILITDPLLMISTAFAWYQFRATIVDLPVVLVPNCRAELRRRVAPYAHFVELKQNGVFLYILLVVLGCLAWINNVYQTNDPVRFFGHKVFDSTEFIFGFAANKLVLFVSWVLVYPACGFVTLSLCLSTFLILRRLRSAGLIKPSVFHPDGCYGLSNLGKLNVCLLVPFLLAFLVLFAILITHARAYASIVVPLIILTALFLAVSVITIQPILSQAREAERNSYQLLRTASMNLPHTDFSGAIAFAIERLCFGMSSGSPYSKTTRALLTVLRAIPVTVTTFKLIAPFV
jgi:hypothetical protein